MKKLLFGIIFSGVFALLLGGCSSNQEIYISNSGEGNIAIDVELDEMIVKYSRDLLGGFSNIPSANLRLFDIEKIADTVKSLKSVNLVQINSDSPNRLHLEFTFGNPGKILKIKPGEGIPEPITFSTERVNGRIRKMLRIYLVRENFGLITSLVGMNGSDIVHTFGPQDDPYSKEEYLDLMEYLFEEYETPSIIRRIIRESEIIIDLKIDGTVINYSGCSVSGRNVIIQIPLLDIVTLKDPIEISVEWE